MTGAVLPFPHPGEQPEPDGDPPPVRRVQRPTDEMPVLHLEPRIPDVDADAWTVTFDGLVDRPRVVPLAELVGLESFAANWDFHCVWGWSRELCRWSGVSGEAVAELVGIAAPHVSVAAHGGSYASALTRQEFGAGMFATHLDGEALPPERGGPVRYIPPPGKWQYKGVKWVARVTGTERFLPGFWERATGDPHGDIPPDREDLRFER